MDDMAMDGNTIGCNGGCTSIVDTGNIYYDILCIFAFNNFIPLSLFLTVNNYKFLFSSSFEGYSYIEIGPQTIILILILG